MKGELIALSVDPETRRQRVTIEIDGDFGETFDKLRGKPVDVKIKPHRRKRSLNANNYAWLLIDKIAAEMSITKEEVYRNAIRNIGGVSMIICLLEKAADKYCEIWTSRGLGWQCERLPSKLPNCVDIVAYYGSSTYDTAQMSCLIEQLIADCHELGIETKSPEELASLLDEWGR